MSEGLIFVSSKPGREDIALAVAGLCATSEIPVWVTDTWDEREDKRALVSDTVKSADHVRTSREGGPAAGRAGLR